MSTTRSTILPAPVTKGAPANDLPSPDRAWAGADLLLVAHGVSGPCAPAARMPDNNLLQRLRGTGLFREIRWGYLKVEPKVESVLDSLTAERVFVLPMLMSDGYFARQQIPVRLGLNGPVTARDGQQVVSCPPLGLQDGLTDVSIGRLKTGCSLEGWKPEEVDVVVVGHGSTNGSASHEAICAHVDALRLRTSYRAVHAAFLEETPSLPDILSGIEGPVLISGFFASEGMHSTMDIPALIGDRDRIRYTGAVGACSSIFDVVLDAVDRGSQLL